MGVVYAASPATLLELSIPRDDGRTVDGVFVVRFTAGDARERALVFRPVELSPGQEHCLADALTFIAPLERFEFFCIAAASNGGRPA
ncbi:MAG: hypothetical protein ABIT01_03080 [Thermoanaerobaculia bacterium]